jgi:uncharacterized membrane protein YbhN (UPF0104 family)
LKLKPNQRKGLTIAAKAIVFIATLYYIYIKVLKDGSLKSSWSELSFSQNEFWLLMLVLMMMFINWSLEAGKWKLLVSTFEKISFKRAFASVWSGVTINNWVPNRMAEFAGRILYVQLGNKGKAVVSTFAGSFAQMLMTLSFGAIGLLFFSHSQAYVQGSIVLLLMAVLFGFFYFRMRWVVVIIRRIRFLKFLLKYMEVLEQFSFTTLLKLVVISFFRYLVYLSQYVLLLILFGVEVEIIKLFYGVALIFLIQTFIPSILLTDIGVRGATVLVVFEKLSPNVAGLFAAAYALWFINLLIPSLVGAVLIMLKKKNRQTV